MSALSPHLPLKVTSWGLLDASGSGVGWLADFDLSLPEACLFLGLGSPTTSSPSVLDPIAGLGLGQGNG